jgi:hypothetical protein
MRQLMTTVMALSVLFVTFAGKAHAEVNYPWCIIGDTRAIDCYFSTREQCMQDGRNRGFGSQCIKNPYYKPGKPTVSQTARPLPIVRRGPLPTCAQLRSACVSSESLCNWALEMCMKTGRFDPRGNSPCC